MEANFFPIFIVFVSKFHFLELFLLSENLFARTIAARRISTRLCTFYVSSVSFVKVGHFLQ